MPWTTASGTELDFPTALWAKIIHARRIRREDVIEAFKSVQCIHTEAVRLSTRVVELESQVRRLTHENEFMLRLLNDERDSG